MGTPNKNFMYLPENALLANRQDIYVWRHVITLINGQ